MVCEVKIFTIIFFCLVPRDINERGRDLDQVLNQYINFVKPAFEEFCSPVCYLFFKLFFMLRNYLECI